MWPAEKTWLRWFSIILRLRPAWSWGSGLRHKLVPYPPSQLSSHFLLFSPDNTPFPFAAVEQGSHWFLCFSFVFQFEVLFGSSLYILISLLKLSISLLWLLSCFKHIHDFSWKDCYYDCFKNICQAALAPGSCWHCCLSLSGYMSMWRPGLSPGVGPKGPPTLSLETGSLTSLRLNP